MNSSYDILIVGGGILGLATAYALRTQSSCSIAIIEADIEVARQQTGHNSGVIHAGVYYKPGSLKAQLCVDGRKRLIRFAEENKIPFEICGKLIVATDE